MGSRRSHRGAGGGDPTSIEKLKPAKLVVVFLLSQLAALEKDYSFKSLRRNPPSGASNVKEAASEMKQKILSVSSSVRPVSDESRDRETILLLLLYIDYEYY